MYTTNRDGGPPGPGIPVRHFFASTTSSGARASASAPGASAGAGVSAPGAADPFWSSVSGGRIVGSRVLRDTLYELGESAGGGVVDERIGEALYCAYGDFVKVAVSTKAYTG